VARYTAVLAADLMAVTDIMVIEFAVEPTVVTLLAYLIDALPVGMVTV
jgi:hypothetical protein